MITISNNGTKNNFVQMIASMIIFYFSLLINRIKIKNNNHFIYSTNKIKL